MGDVNQENQASGQQPARGASGRSWLYLIRETMETVLIALVLALVIRAFLVESFLVQGTSMQPNLHDGERLLVNKLVYRFKEPVIGDIIVFRYPRQPERDFIKRVIARSGEAVEIRDGQVFVSDRPLPETYLIEQGHSYYPRTLVPEDSLFVLGDNRNNSEDSRFFGFVPEENVKGKAFLVYWPLKYLHLFIAPAVAENPG